MKKVLVILIFSICMFVWVSAISFADTSYPFDCSDPIIKGSIRYSIIGQYNFYFKECSGALTFDSAKRRVKSVRLEINLKSINSNCQWCDKIVLSKNILDANTYPSIVVESDTFGENERDRWMLGGVHLHGVSKELKFPFSMAGDEESGLVFKGKWALRRKDFNVVWNKVMDHGGVVVGDYVTVDCDVKTKRRK